MAKPPMCKICGHAHWGVEHVGLSKGEALAEAQQTITRGSSSGRTAGFGPADEGSNPSPRAKFDRNAYQRDLMRKRRATKATVMDPKTLDMSKVNLDPMAPVRLGPK